MSILFNARQGLSVGPSALQAIDASNNLTVANLSASGTLFGSALSITADAGQYAANAIRLRTTTTNTATALTIMPNGTNQSSTLRLYNKDDVTGTNVGAIELSVNGTAVSLNGVQSGTGIAPTTLSTGLGVTITSTSGLSVSAGTISQTMSAQTSAIRLGQVSDSTALGQISFNSAYALATMQGIYGGGSGTTLSLSVPTGHSIVNKVNDVAVSTTSGSGIVINGSLSTTTSATIGTDLIVTGNLTVNGTTTTINTATLSVDDINIELGSVTTPTDTTAIGGGLTLRGTTNKTITWNNATNGWEFNQHVTVTGNISSTGPINGLTNTALATGFSVAGGTTSKTLTVSNTLTLAGTDSSTLNIGAGGTLGSAAYTATTAYVSKTAATGSAALPVGTTAQRDGTPSTGYTRFNSDYVKAEVYNGTGWSGLGGATGAGGDDVFYENGQTVTTNYTITTGKNAVSAGPITINTGVTVTIPTGSVWSVV